MSIDIEKFWLVWNPNGGNPTRRHPSREAAMIEAERLAVKEPGASFFVLKAVCGSYAHRPIAEAFRMVAPNTTDLPF